MKHENASFDDDFLVKQFELVRQKPRSDMAMNEVLHSI